MASPGSHRLPSSHDDKNTLRQDKKVADRPDRIVDRPDPICVSRVWTFGRSASRPASGSFTQCPSRYPGCPSQDAAGFPAFLHRSGYRQTTGDGSSARCRCGPPGCRSRHGHQSGTAGYATRRAACARQSARQPSAAPVMDRSQSTQSTAPRGPRTRRSVLQPGGRHADDRTIDP